MRRMSSHSLSSSMNGTVVVPTTRMRRWKIRPNGWGFHRRWVTEENWSMAQPMDFFFANGVVTNTSRVEMDVSRKMELIGISVYSGGAKMAFTVLDSLKGRPGDRFTFAKQDIKVFIAPI